MATSHALANGDSPAAAWQLNESGIAVWPVGAFEQHGPHLPVDTDGLLAQYFAEFVAGELGACLLPLQAVGTSLEHTGFRGSFSLTPELLMQLVRNWADELEAQNFHTCIVVNFHGGNFSLAPAVRDINRKDRRIKFLLVNSWEFISSATEEVHGGEFETSLMLHLFPSLVKKNAVDEDPCKAEPPFGKSDLNTFGFGRISGSGVWGYPTKASAVKGRKWLAGMKAGMLPHINKQLDRLSQDRRYGGPGPVALRPMTEADIPLGMRLKRLAHWNQLEGDWRMLLAASGGGNFVALHNGTAAGTVTTVTYQDHFSWIGMVLVDPANRRCGVGTALLTAAVDYAGAFGPVRLDATPAGEKLYDALGFREESRLARYECRNFAAVPPAAALRTKPITARSINAVATYDAQIFGAERKSVLKSLQSMAPELGYVAMEGKAIIGFCLGRAGEDFTQIGPVVADSPTVAAALLYQALAQCRGQDVIIDSLDRQAAFNGVLAELGFQVQRPFIRMCKGKLKHPGVPQMQFAIAGPEVG